MVSAQPAADPADRGGALELQFDGIATHCTVWLNGTVVQRNWCGYTLSAIDVATLAVKRFPIPSELASVHFNRSPDGKFTTAEGNAQNKRMSLLRKRDGRLEPELLMTMEKHDYKNEPDTHVSPDGKWVVFHSGQPGELQLYAVAAEKCHH